MKVAIVGAGLIGHTIAHMLRETGDYEVVAKHLNVLQQYSEQYRDAYDALNRLAELVLAHDAANDSPSGAPVRENKKAKAQYTGGKG